MLIDPAFPMVLRNDAVRVHSNAVRRDFAITEETFDLYGLAGLTEGEDKLWARFAALEQGKPRYGVLQRLIARQPSLRLALLLDDLSEIMLAANICDLRTREGALLALRWVEKGCPAGLLPPSTTGVIGPQLVALRGQRFGWIVPPQSGGRDRGVSTEEGEPMEYPRVWLSEAQLERYRTDVGWPDIFE